MLLVLMEPESFRFSELEFPYFSFKVLKKFVNLNRVYEPKRGQYDARKAIELLMKEVKGWKVVGLTSRDLFVPGLNFVFGLASPKWGYAIVSWHRLRQEFYGLKPNETLLKERIIKEVLHEFGHLLGLGHCELPCVMSFSNTVFHIDLKLADFCEGCRRKLNKFIEI